MLASPDEAPAEVSAAPRGVGDRFCDLAVFIVSTYYLNLQSVLHIYIYGVSTKVPWFSAYKEYSRKNCESVLRLKVQSSIEKVAGSGYLVV